MSTDMRYMDFLGEVTEDAVGLIREKTGTYGDSWKRRGGPGAWFTTVRPWDRLEKIVDHHGGNIFDAVRDDPEGHDGSALACVRDIMNYLILIEAHARVVLGVGRHGPARKTEEPEKRCTCPVGAVGRHLDTCPMAEPPGFRDASVFPLHVRFTGTPENGSHHALGDDARLDAMERAGEVTQDTRGAGGSAGRRTPGDRLEAFRVRMLALSEELEIPVETRTSALGELLIVEIDLRKMVR